MLKVTAIILAAGQSRRMGSQNKLLKVWNDKPLVEHVCLEAIGSKCDEIVVVTGHENQLVEKALKHLDVNIVYNPEFENGIASSINAGIKSAMKLDSDAVLILLGDMPQITASMIERMIDTRMRADERSVIVAASQGKQGNPLLWPACYFGDLLKLKGDEGARQILQRYEDQIVTVELGSAACFDLDTPDAFKSTATP